MALVADHTYDTGLGLSMPLGSKVAWRVDGRWIVDHHAIAAVAAAAHPEPDDAGRPRSSDVAQNP